ncbi:MAG: TlyA family RNA methyltransferase [Anaerolineae bacterium]|nr:TlyA family RNA methyltransferase [Anaerolineae bacterium]NUQ02464.1 TlyA family RNA methyltransferase [Anaerolineae bacterium]
MSGKQRLDALLLNRGLAPNQDKARAYIMAGEILVNGAVVDKPGTLLAADVEIVLRARPRYVSRGGEKLAAALESFPLKVAGRVCADVGASTGGFTDCLLQNGASRVYALDVGYGHLAYALREDPRVVVMERTNARFVEALPENIDCVVIDASFISLRLLLPVIQGWLASSADVVPLVKPQFEAGRRDVAKGGVVQDREVHRQVLAQTLDFAVEIGFLPCGLIRSPLKGPAGNIEFLAWLGWNNDCSLQSVESLIDAVL